MKHWFVGWLEKCAQQFRSEAEHYRSAFERYTHERTNLELSVEDPHYFLTLAARKEENAERLENWAELAEEGIKTSNIVSGL
ncbi:hypothetical protein [Effusibacillus consociatus]|uniref:Uncharacterized protein n=1 Tax=Effusibacillus consociatus TaxID=1117041 RepID=A0ABV9Q1W6_9BACL